MNIPHSNQSTDRAQLVGFDNTARIVSPFLRQQKLTMIGFEL